MVFSMKRWEGKVAVVTGASSGIGAAIAKQLVEQGLIVVGIARRIELVEKLANEESHKRGIARQIEVIEQQVKELTINRNGRLIPYKADIANEGEIIKAFKWIEDNVGPVHILVNNAGILFNNTLIDGNIEQWRQVFEVNVMGLCIATREAINQMKAKKINGHIIHINSVAGHYVPALPVQNVYPASKHAVTALTETLRREINEGKLPIKITSISPGLVESGITTKKENLTEEEKQFLSDFPILKAESVADAVHYVLSTPKNVQISELTIRPVGETF